MKFKKAIIATLFVFIFNIAFSQWTKLPVPPTSGISFSPADDIRPVADGKLYFGVNMHYKLNYDLYHSNYDLSDCHLDLPVEPATAGGGLFNQLNSANDSTICFTSMNSSIYFTFNHFKNQRKTWDGNRQMKASSITSKFLYYCCSYGDDTLRIVRTDTSLVKTVTKLPPKYLSQRLDFINDSVGFYLVFDKSNSSKTTLLRSLNYGQSWTGVITDSVNEIIDFSFGSISTGYLIKANGSVHKSTNGGTTFSQVALLTSSLTCVKFANDTLGYIGGKNGLLWKTIDGGQTWQGETSNTIYTINSLYTFGNVAYFKSGNEEVYKNGPLAVGIRTYERNTKVISVYPNPVSEELTLDLSSLPENPTDIAFVNVFGNKIFEESSENLLNQGIYKFSVKHMSSGAYLIIEHTKSFSFQKKIIVVK